MVSIRELGMPGTQAATQGMLDQLSSNNRLKSAGNRMVAGGSSEPPSIQNVMDTIQLGGVDSIGQANRAMTEHVLGEIRKLLEETPANRLPRPVAEPAEFTPEDTADYIVGNVVSFYPLYAGVHEEDIADDQERLDTFMSLVGDAITTGFEEARSILDSLDALNDEIGQGIDQTYSLVQAGLNSFRALQTSLIEERAAALGAVDVEEDVVEDEASLTVQAAEAAQENASENANLGAAANEQADLADETE